MTRRRAIGWLILVSFVWGSGFAFTKQALDAISPLVYMALRFGLAAALIAHTLRHASWPEVRAGLVLGALFWTGFVFQTVGLTITTPSRSAFITSLSSILVPAVALAAHRTVPGKFIVWAIVLATGGMYFLTAPAGGGINNGDILTLGCAFIFAGHIVAAAYYAQRFNAARLLALQLGLSAALSIAAAPLLETPRLVPTVPAIAIVVLMAITGLWSFYMQFRAQRHLTPSDAGLVFMLEPVFATVTSFVLVGERFTALQWFGGLLILAALAVPVLGERWSTSGRSLDYEQA